MYHYTYLILSLVFFSFWVVIFILRKDLRKEMLWVSPFFAMLGPFTDIFYNQDWWQPETLTGGVISPEPLLTAFSIGGVGSVAFDFVANLKKPKNDGGAVFEKNDVQRFLMVFIPGLIVFVSSFYVFKVDSLVTTVIAVSGVVVYVLWRRPDLALNSVISGIMLFAIAVTVYSIVNLFTPGWVSAFWFFQNTPERMILSLPMDDVIWYTLSGMLIGPGWEYFQGVKGSSLINRK